MLQDHLNNWTCTGVFLRREEGEEKTTKESKGRG